jgi:hypothetical protein
MVRRGAPEGGLVRGRCLMKETSMNEIEILGAAKAVGQADIAPGYKLFTGAYLGRGRILGK